MPKRDKRRFNKQVMSLSVVHDMVHVWFVSSFSHGHHISK